MQSYFPIGQIFFPSSQNIDKSVSTVMLSEFSFSKTGKNKSNFWMVNLCNGTKDFVELWEIILLNI